MTFITSPKADHYLNYIIVVYLLKSLRYVGPYIVSPLIKYGFCKLLLPFWNTLRTLVYKFKIEKTKIIVIVCFENSKRSVSFV